MYDKCTVLQVADNTGRSIKHLHKHGGCLRSLLMLHVTCSMPLHVHATERVQITNM